MIKLLITGCKGQLGGALLNMLEAGGCALGPLPRAYEGCNVTAIDIDELDLTNERAVYDYITARKVDVVINCAAYTNVDACEKNYDIAYKVNADAPGYVAKACAAAGSKMVHVSTDYVFSGVADTPYKETDTPAPNTAYGKTKLAGEEAVKAACEQSFIVRTAWLYGLQGGNFVKTMQRVGRSTGKLTVVNDQIGSPTNAEDLAYHLLQLAVTDKYGTYHVTNKGVCSWYDFACEIIRLSGIVSSVDPCTTEEYKREHPQSAPRPMYSVLAHDALEEAVGDSTRPWQEALEDYIIKLKAIGN